MTNATTAAAKARRAVLVGLGAIALAVLVVLGARLSDGPVGFLPGGALRSGEWVDAPVADWSFAKDVAEVELALEGERSSRTTWILVDGGQAWIPCSLSFPPFKRWHERAAADGRAVLRIDGRRYPVTLVREEFRPTRRRLELVAHEKYENLPPTDGGVWLFRVESRAR